jgi:hypothetical protein
MSGGPSHIDTFDPKPTLADFAGKPCPTSLERLGTPGRPTGLLMPSPLKFSLAGKSGLPISELFPELMMLADDLCVVRSLYADSAVHGSACLQANTGGTRLGGPSLGSWVSAGLGSLRDDVPAYVVLHDPRGGPNAGPANWSSGPLSPIHQGTLIRQTGPPLLALDNPAGVSNQTQSRVVDTVRRLNAEHARRRQDDAQLLARTRAMELAFQLQTSALDLFDLEKESAAVRESYGVGRGPTDVMGRQCLTARRLLERGVRYLQIYSGAAGLGDSWDGHSDCAANHRARAAESDRPMAAFLRDLKRTGLWNDTLVVWMGEFGRTPTADGVGKLGRDHHPHGFSIWLAGGPIKGGQAIGATDELGLQAVDRRYHVTDLLATILLAVGVQPPGLKRDHAGGQPLLFSREVHPILEAFS